MPEYSTGNNRINRHSTSFYSLSTSSDIYLSSNTNHHNNNSFDSSYPPNGDISTELPNIKLLLIGDANVGKTAMILRFCHELPTRGQLRDLQYQKNYTSIIPATKHSKLPFRRRKIISSDGPKRDKKRYSSTDFDEFNNKNRRSLIFTNNYSSLFNEQIGSHDGNDIKYDNDDEVMLYTQSTIGVDIKTRLINIDSQFFNCTFWDTAGQERYRNALIPSLYKHCNGIILTYDITNYKSFQSCFETWLMESLKYLPREQLKRCRIYLIGNKIDLYPEREVTHQDILKSIFQVEKRLNVKIQGNFEVTCQWGEIIENIMNSIIIDLVSNGCYQDVNRTIANFKNILSNESEEEEDDSSFYSFGSNNVPEDKIVNLNKQKDPIPYSCCT